MPAPAPTPSALAAAACWAAEGRFPVLFRRGFDGVTAAACGAALKDDGASPAGFAERWRRLRDEAERRGIDPRLPILFHCFFDPSMGAAAPWLDFPPVSLHVPECVHEEREGTVDPSAVEAPAATSPVPAGAPAFGGVDWNAEWYRAAVRRALAAIDGGEARKLVIAREIVLGCSRAVDPLRVAAALLRRPSPGAVLVVIPRRGTAFVCSTPERLVRVEGGRAHSIALAGTLWGKGPAPPMTDKLREEHAHVADMLRAELGALGEVETGETAVVDAGAVRHYATPVAARLRAGVGLADAVAALHPTPAVAGVPRGAAMELIRRIEGFHRGLYAGVAGWGDRAGDGEAAVTIRSALIAGAEARVYAGAGIVRASGADEEEEETRMKAQGMLDALREG